MKFFHLSDLHFGKQVHKVQMADQDQPFWVERLLEAVDTHQPDAIVIAGDVYDRKNPSPEAMKLFAHMLTELVKREKYVFIIPGNHDSDTRLAHISDLLTSHKVYIAGELKKDLMHISVPDGDSAVNFWLMPYVFPKLVSDEAVLGMDNLETYDAAVRALLAEQSIDENACNVLVAHQNVLANGNPPVHSESETIIGGVGEIEVDAFDKFDYVALGHIHNEQPVGRETVRYAGCPLFYDFSEEDRWKGIVMVTVNGKEDIRVDHIEIPLLHRFKRIFGTAEEIIAQGLAIRDMSGWYYQAVLQDRHVPSGAMDRIYDIFGEALINTKRDLDAIREQNAAERNAAGDANAVSRQLTLSEQFSLFYNEQGEDAMDEVQENLVQMIIDHQSHHGSDYVRDSKLVPKDESNELLAYLLSIVEEDN